jgi:hypothetical protein
LNKSDLINKIAMNYFAKQNIENPSDNYKTAIYKTIETLGFYDNKETKRTAVIPLETGQGKSSLIKLLMPELYIYDKTQSGSIILLPYTKQCDKLCEDINKLAEKNIAAAFHSKTQISRKELRKFPILIMTHERFIGGTDNLEDYSWWIDYSKFQGMSNEPVKYKRERLIVDESINKINLLTISNKTLALLDEFFQQQKNKHDFALWQKTSNAIREMFIVPVLPALKDKTKIVKLEEEIPKRLIEVVNIKAGFDRDDIKKAFKAIVNLSINGGILKMSSNSEYRRIQTAGYINVFSPHFKSIVLDGTARIDKTYQNKKYFEIIDIPKTKLYENVTLHIERKATGSRSSIEKDDTLITRTIQYVNEKLIDREVLLICHKKFVRKFNCLPKNVSVAHWWSFDGSNEYNQKDCIVFCGSPYLDESHYIYLYHTFSGDKNYSRNQIYKPGGKVDPVVRFTDPFYEEMRKSYLAVQFVQSINRGVCRNYNNDISMHCFLPFGDMEILKIIKNELTGIEIIEDYTLLEKELTTKNNNIENKNIQDTVVNILSSHNMYFGDERVINKNTIFNLDEIKNNFKCNSKAVQAKVWKSPEILELQNIGAISINKKQIHFLN